MHGAHNITQVLLLFFEIGGFFVLLAGGSILFYFFRYRWRPLLLQKFTSWDEIKKKYPLQVKFNGEWLTMQSMRPGVGTNGVLWSADLGFTPDFLYVQCPSKNFQISIPPVQIPTSSIVSIEEHKGLLNTHYVFVIRDVPPITFYRTNELEQYLQNNKTKLPFKDKAIL